MGKRTWDHAKVDQGEGAIAWLDLEFSSHFFPLYVHISCFKQLSLPLLAITNAGSPGSAPWA